MSARLCWVVAFRPEALPVIRHYDLQPVKGASSLFPVFSSADQQVELVLSGPGLANAAAATTVLALRAEQTEVCPEIAWINFGIAGCGPAELGSIWLAAKVSQDGSRECWYPQVCWPRAHDRQRGQVVTVASPRQVSAEDPCLYEMEAAGMMSVASRISSLEFCQALKVVSDNAGHPFTRIDKGGVEALCHTALQQSLPWLEAYRDALQQHALHSQPPPEYQECLARWHFTETEKHQLKRLLQQRSATQPAHEPFLPEPCQSAASARDVLRSLRQVLWG